MRSLPFAARRAALGELLPVDSGLPLHLSAASGELAVARRWLELQPGAGIDRVLAKALTLHYLPCTREMVKVKRELTGDCVVGGFRVRADAPAVGSLLLGLYDESGELRHVGVSSQVLQRPPS